MRSDEELMTKLTKAVDRLADSAEYIAFGIAKMVERCFCGDRLDEHPENGPCTNAKCQASCQFFMPVHLAIARTLNAATNELGFIRQLMMQGVAAQQSDGKIVKVH